MNRKPCLKALSYLTCPVAAPPNIMEKPPGLPICIAKKNKCCQGIQNVFISNRGFPDHSDKFSILLHNINGGPVLRKLKHPPPPLDIINLLFSFRYDESLHGNSLCKNLDLSHLNKAFQDRVYALVKKYWPVFDNHGVFILVKKYECVIDTGNTTQIAVKKIQYGPKKLPIMRQAISALKKVGHIHQIHDGWLLFKAVLAPKPHQEHVCHIEDFIWRFCINYVPLNTVTWIIAYPIPCCDLAVSEKFGMGLWMWLYDAPWGYHQLAIVLASQEILAFQGPDMIKWMYTMMPFGPMNGLGTFVNFIYNVNSQWKSLPRASGIAIDNSTNTHIIIDNIVSHGKDLETSLL
jgi:hypothetical protein